MSEWKGSLINFIINFIIILIGLYLVSERAYQRGLNDAQRLIIHIVDNAGALMVGKITDKEIIDGKHTVTVGAYGKFLVTEEQYESVSVGDEIPEYLRGRVYEQTEEAEDIY